MSQETLFWHPCRLILDPHCQLASVRIKLTLYHDFYSRKHLSLQISLPSFSVFFSRPHRSLGPQSTFPSLSQNKTKTKKQKPRSCDQSNNPLTYTVSTARQTRVSVSKARGQPNKGSEHSIPLNYLESAYM